MRLSSPVTFIDALRGLYVSWLYIESAVAMASAITALSWFKSYLQVAARLFTVQGCFIVSYCYVRHPTGISSTLFCIYIQHLEQVFQRQP